MRSSTALQNATGQNGPKSLAQRSLSGWLPRAAAILALSLALAWSVRAEAQSGDARPEAHAAAPAEATAEGVDDQAPTDRKATSGQDAPAPDAALSNQDPPEKELLEQDLSGSGLSEQELSEQERAERAFTGQEFEGQTSTEPAFAGGGADPLGDAPVEPPAVDGREALEQPAAETAAIPPACGPVVVAEFSWPAAELASALLARVISDGYDCAAVRLSASPERAMALIGAGVDVPLRHAEDDGAAQDDATPLHGLLIAPGVLTEAVDAAEGATKGAELYAGGERAGWYAPLWVLEANPRIRSLADAAGAPEVFAPESGGRPRVHLCPKHWPCYADSLALVERLGIERSFEIVTPLSGDALTAALIDAFIRREPWLGFYWSPSATLAEYPMRLLTPGGLELCEKSASGAESCHTPFAGARPVTAYSTALEEERPRIAELLGRFSIPGSLAQDALAWKLANSASYDQTATHMLQTYPSLWRGWLDPEARDLLAEKLVAEVSRGGTDRGLE